MKFFKKKKASSAKSVFPQEKKRPAEKGKVAKAHSPSTSTAGRSGAHVLRRPRITEKATLASEQGAYVFEVDPRATKRNIAHAFEEVYGVKPVKVNTVKIFPKKVQSRTRGLFGRKPQGKKAYVYLKEGETIEII